MLDAGKLPYIYAKICGILRNSFVGNGLSRLNGVSRLSDLDRLIFFQGNREMPDRRLLPDIEDRITKRAIDQIITIINAFTTAPALLVQLIRNYEYDDLKAAFAAFDRGEHSFSVYTDIGKFRTVHFEAYPDWKAMLKKSIFESLPEQKDLLDTQIALDRHYYTGLLDALYDIPKKKRKTIEKIITDEISLYNAVWALRLRLYYQLEPEAVREKLIATHGLDTDAVNSLSFAVDNFAEWSHWKWKKFLNPDLPTHQWRADPRFLQNAASRYIYRLTFRSLHQRPFSLDSAFCFIKLKQYEENILTSFAEGLGLGMPNTELSLLLDIPVT
jgi:vacuolar-type H+-ATPase subunit C/Vma6